MVFDTGNLFSLWSWRNFDSIKAMWFIKMKQSGEFSWETGLSIKCNCFAGTKKPYYLKHFKYFADTLLLYTSSICYRCKTPAGTRRWKQASQTWRAFEKIEGTLTRMKDSTGDVPLQSAEAVLVWGPSLQVKGWLLCVEECPDTQCGASRSDRAWWDTSEESSHRCPCPSVVFAPRQHHI